MSIVKGKGGIEAKIVLASIAKDIPIITMQLKYPRWVHGEFLTHRMFSRNASSSRAIPVEKLLDQVRNNPAMPIHWGKNKPGMQANEEIENQDSKYTWIHASRMASRYAKSMSKLGLHKQVVNRILEPYQFMHTVVTATEWDNFFKLRAHKDAQPEIQELALCMKEAMASCDFTKLEPGDWHLPYILEEEYYYPTDMLQKASVARCARVSYLNHDKTNSDIEKDLRLAEKLLEAGHMSPCEHQATPMHDPTSAQHYSPTNWQVGVTHMDKEFNLYSGNFRSWVQYRQTL